MSAERSRDSHVLSSVLSGHGRESEYESAAYADVPSAGLQKRGRSGIKTQAPKKKPKGLFGSMKKGGGGGGKGGGGKGARK